MDVKNKFLSYNHFKEKININCSILQNIGLIDAIPSTWHTLKEKSGTKWLSIDKCTSQIIYWKHIEKEASCIKAWHNGYNVCFSSKDWQSIYVLALTLTSETKLREFQLKFFA